MTLDQLKAKHQELSSILTQQVADANATRGAVQILEQMINEEIAAQKTAPEPPKE